jgi:hypothetical protein
MKLAGMISLLPTEAEACRRCCSRNSNSICTSPGHTDAEMPMLMSPIENRQSQIQEALPAPPKRHQPVRFPRPAVIA